MFFHIVQLGETIEDISKSYEVGIKEISKYNEHVSNIKKVAPGMKLRIPKAVVENVSEIEEITPFVEDYYPTINEINEDSEEKYVVNSVDEGLTVNDSPKPDEILQNGEVIKEVDVSNETAIYPNYASQHFMPNYMFTNPMYYGTQPYYYQNVVNKEDVTRSVDYNDNNGMQGLRASPVYVATQYGNQLIGYVVYKSE